MCASAPCRWCIHTYISSFVKDIYIYSMGLFFWRGCCGCCLDCKCWPLSRCV
jgi:hypothetical protein